MSVDFGEVNRNIRKDNLDINLIRIIYEELTDFEIEEILKYQRGENIGNRRVLSNYPENMDPLCKEKAQKILYLGAD